MLLRHEDQNAYWDDVYFADDNVFDVFTHEIVYGDPKTALAEPDWIAISQPCAQRYFGDENPVGRTLTTDGGESLDGHARVRGAARELAPALRRAVRVQGLRGSTVPTDITERLPAAARAREFRVHLRGARGRRRPARVRPVEPGVLREVHEFRAANGQPGVAELARAARGHPLEPRARYDLPTGNRMYLYAFAAVAVFILFVACINYVNLATARAAQRTRAIGLAQDPRRRARLADRAVPGESVLFALLATVLGVILVEVLLPLPAVSALFGKTLTLDLFGRPCSAWACSPSACSSACWPGSIRRCTCPRSCRSRRSSAAISRRRIAAARSARLHSVRDLDRRDRRARC